MERFRLSEHAYVRVLNYDTNGALIDCDTGYPTLTVYDPAERTILSATTMTKSDTGDYYYEPALTDSPSPRGSWRWDAEHRTNGSITHSEGAFEVV